MIDVRVRLSESSTVDRFAVLPSDLAQEYPAREELHLLHGEFQIGGGVVAEGSLGDLGVRGYRFISESKSDVVQFRLDGFTFSRLRPYSSWEKVLADAVLFWNHYSSVASVEAAVRIAVRYINNFVIPPGRSVADYLTALPTMPDGLQRTTLRASLSRLLLHDVPTGANSLVAQALEHVNGSGTHVVIDIDSYKTGDDLGLAGDEFWPHFEQLRDVKNRIFFGSITEAAAQEFE